MLCLSGFELYSRWVPLKFIKLHDCIPVNIRFAVYTQNFLSLNGISWYKTSGYYI